MFRRTVKLTTYSAKRQLIVRTMKSKIILGAYHSLILQICYIFDVGMQLYIVAIFAKISQTYIKIFLISLNKNFFLKFNTYPCVACIS